MSELFTPPADGWFLVPPGVPCWGRTVMHTPDGRMYTNVPPPEPEAMDVTTWTERTDRRLAALEDAAKRLADTVQYLLLRLEGDK